MAPGDPSSHLRNTSGMRGGIFLVEKLFLSALRTLVEITPFELLKSKNDLVFRKVPLKMYCATSFPCNSFLIIFLGHKL